MKITGILKAFTISLVLVGSVSFPTAVRASITPTLAAGSPTGVAPGPFTFTYSVLLSSDQKINTGAVPAISVFTAPGTPGADFASFFTIYDFLGFNGVHTEPAGWGFQSLLLGSTPSTTVPIDQASISNLTWFWTGAGGAVVPNPGSILVLFSAQSTEGLLLDPHSFTSAATLIAENVPNDPANNTAATQHGTVVAPGLNPPPPPGQVPEPATLLLLGTGLAGLAGWRKWSAKKS